MTQVGVRRSPLSLWSSILMIVLGIITILFVSYVLGLALAAVGLVMYLVYVRLDRRSRAKGSAAARPP